MPRYLTEFLGAFFLILTISLVVATSAPLGALAIGSVLMVMVYMGGHISGGHYNPAVTLAVFLRGKLKAAEVLPYWGAQVAGGILAALIGALITGRSFAVTVPNPEVGALAALAPLAIEVLFTFALALVVLNVATTRATQGNSYFGLAIGFTITVAAIAGGPISGGAFNPAVGLGLAIVNLIRGGSLGPVWIYLVGPLLGGGLAALAFRMQYAGTDEMRESPIGPRDRGHVPPQTPAGPTERPA
jgi:aquaporin Z